MSTGIDFILASASPRRRQLCEEAGYRFEVRVSSVIEPPTTDFSSPEAYAVHTAWLKANDVASGGISDFASGDPIDVASGDLLNVASSDLIDVASGDLLNVASSDSEWVIGADTIVAHGSTIIGKPADRRDAERILRTLSGTRHRVITGLCVVLPREGLSLVDHVVTTVEMKQLSDRELAEYLDTNLWEGKAGAYGIQDEQDPFVMACEGSFSNVVGLPMERLGEVLDLARRMTKASSS